MSNELASRTDRLATEEARLDAALDSIAGPLGEARLAAYRIRRYDLWKAALDERGKPLYNTLGDYFSARWETKFSRTLFFGYGSTLQRLASVGLSPERVIADSRTSHDFDHQFTLKMGAWDYRKQELAEPAPGLLALQEESETVEATVKRLYLESKDEAEEYGSGEALNILDQKLGRSTVEFFQDSPEDAPLRLRAEVTTYLHDEQNPALITETFLISSDKTLPREVVVLLKKRTWIKPSPRSP